MIEKPQFTEVNEDFEIIFNAAGAESRTRAKGSMRSSIGLSLSEDFVFSGKLIF